MLCLKVDVLLITDVFQNCIDTCKFAHGINQFYSYSTPSFIWKAGFKYTGVQFNFITDDIFETLDEKNLRGGP